MNAWIKYSVIRIALFAGAFALLLLLGVDGVIAAIIAALVGLCVSYIFLSRERDAVASALASRIAKPRAEHNADAAEDEALDRAE